MGLSNQGDIVSKDQSYWLMDQMTKRFFFYRSFANLVLEMFLRVPSTIKRVKWILSEAALKELLWVNRKRHTCSMLKAAFISNDNNEQKQFHWMKTGWQEFVNCYKASIEFWYSNQQHIWFRMTLQFFQPTRPFCLSVLSWTGWQYFRNLHS